MIPEDCTILVGLIIKTEIIPKSKCGSDDERAVIVVRLQHDVAAVQALPAHQVRGGGGRGQALQSSLGGLPQSALQQLGGLAGRLGQERDSSGGGGDGLAVLTRPARPHRALAQAREPWRGDWSETCTAYLLYTSGNTQSLALPVLLSTKHTMQHSNKTSLQCNVCLMCNH